MEVGKSLPYILIVLVLLLSYFVFKENDLATLFTFISLLPIFIYMKYDGRISVGAAISLLIFCSILLSLGYEELANTFAIYAYWFLVVGVLTLFFEYLKEERGWDWKTPEIKFNIPKFKTSYLILLILFISVFINFYLHRNYHFPFHVDEWFHIGIARSIINNNYKIGVELWTGHSTPPVALEYGWHHLLAAYGFLTGDSLFSYMFFSTLMSILAVLSTYFFAKRWGKEVGLISALFVATLPANVTIGGMTMLLPMNLFFIFMPICLKIAFDFEKSWYPLLFGILFFLWLSHPPTAAIISIILGIYSLICLKDKRKKGIYLLMTTILAFAFDLVNLIPDLIHKSEPLVFKFWVTVAGLPFLFGIAPTILFLIGAYFVIEKSKKEELSMLISIVFLVIMIIYYVKTGETLLIPVNRIYLPVMAIMSIISGIGFKELLNQNWMKEHLKIVLIFFVLVSAGINIYNNLKTPYYHLINEKEYQDFLWIKENTSEDAVFLLDPWKARPFYPITMRRVVSVMPFGPDSPLNEINKEIFMFLKNNCKNTNVLIKYKPDYVYSEEKCENSCLEKLGHNLYRVTCK